MSGLSVVFDMGNVLIDWDPRAVYRPLFADEAELGLFMVGLFRRMHYAVHDSELAFGDALAPLRTQHPGEQHLIDIFETRWREFLRGPMAESVAVVEELAESGVPLYGLTNWPHQVWPPRAPETADADDHDYGFLRHFRDIVVSGRVKMAKPDPAIYAHALERFRLRAEDAVFVDDLGANVDAAREMGMAAIRFTEAGALRAELAALGLLDRAGSGL